MFTGALAKLLGTAQTLHTKIKSPIKDFCSKCDLIPKKLQILDGKPECNLNMFHLYYN